MSAIAVDLTQVSRDVMRVQRGTRGMDRVRPLGILGPGINCVPVLIDTVLVICVR